MSRFVKIFVLLAFFVAFSFAQGPVSVYGALKACKDGSNKGRICGSKNAYANTPVQIKGVSLGWSNTGWESSTFFNANTVNNMVNGWKAEIVRVPIGYSESGGYKTDASNLTRVKTAIDAAIANGVYVIIDWHSHSAESETAAAAAFFSEMARSYGSKDNAIFEVYNEPLAVSWTTIRNYANTVIDTIRKYSDNLILVGTPNWSQNVDAVTSNSISKSNIGYVLHFYAAEHPLNGYTASLGGNTSRQFQTAVTMVLDAGYPVFISEYGTVMANGNGAHSATNSNAWHTFMNTHKLSSCAWNVNNKGESSAFFKTSFTNPNGQSLASFTNKSNMNESGQYIYDMLISHASSAPWSNGSTPSSSNSGGSSSSGGGSAVTLLADFEGWGTDPAAPRYNYSRLGNPFYVYKVDNATIVNPFQAGTTEYDAITSSGDSHGRVAWLKEGFNVGTKVPEPTNLNGTVAIGLNVDLGTLTGCTAFEYDYKGPAHSFFPNQKTHDGAYSGDWNQPHGNDAKTTASTSWKTVTINVPSDLVPSWGTTSTWVGAYDINKLTWEIRATSTAQSPSSTQSLMIDNIKCIGANLTLPPPPTGSSGSSSSSSKSSSSTASGGSSSSSAKNSSSSTASGGSSSSGAKNSSGSNVFDDSSSSDFNISPILTLPQIAFSNSAIASKNGISLAVKSNAVVEVFSLKGNSIRKFNFANGVYTVSFPDLPKGLYIVKVSFESEKKILRVPVN